MSLRERIVNQSFAYDPISAAVNGVRILATEDGGSLHLDVRKADVARFIARHTKASEADAHTAIEHAVEDGFLTYHPDAGTVNIPRERTENRP